MKKKTTGAIVWVEGYDPVNVTLVYILEALLFRFRLRVVHGDSEFYRRSLSLTVGQVEADFFFCVCCRFQIPLPSLRV